MQPFWSGRGQPETKLLGSLERARHWIAQLARKRGALIQGR